MVCLNIHHLIVLVNAEMTDPLFSERNIFDDKKSDKPTDTTKKLSNMENNTQKTIFNLAWQLSNDIINKTLLEVAFK